MGMKRKKRASRRRGWLLGSSATQVICISFVLLIALGTLLLTLPISSRSGRLGVVDAMFTATSATCVTGLVVRDTWTQFTPFGQAVVLLLIQVGGLGLVTLTSFFALAAKRRMGFKDLRLLGESVSASGYSQATDVLKIVVKLAMTFEIIGMASGSAHSRPSRRSAMRVSIYLAGSGSIPRWLPMSVIIMYRL